VGSADGKIQAELVVVMGGYLAALNQAQAAMAKFAQGVGPATKPANDAIDGLGKSVQRYKAEQASQARTANFFVRELTDITGMSKEAAGAVGGLGEVMLEAAAGGSAFAIGFEAAKFAVTQAAAEWRRGKEEMKALLDVQTRVTGALMEGKYALDKLTAKKETGGDKAFKETFDQATKGVQGVIDETEKLREKGPGIVAWVQAAFGDNAGLLRFEDVVAKASESIGTMVQNAKEFATYSRDFAGGWEESPDQNKRYWDIKAEDEKRNREAGAEVALRSAKLQGDQQGMAVAHSQAIQKIRDDVALTAGIRERMLGVEEREYALAVQLAQIKRMPAPEQFSGFEDGARLDPNGELQRLADQERMARESARIAEETRNDETSGAFSGFEMPGGLGENANLAEEQAKKAHKLQQAWIDVGQAMGGAFSSLGNAIGGAAGKFLGSIGEMISKAIQFAIAIAAASAAETPLIGGFMAAAAAVSLAAALISTVAGVPSYDVGTYSVPRTGLALVHQGEAILPVGGPAEAYRAGSGSGSSNVSVVFNAPVDRDWWAANRTHIVEQIREATRDRRL
jgi:hypothetical protein